jgi:hypothetical protein
MAMNEAGEERDRSISSPLTTSLFRAGTNGDSPGKHRLPSGVQTSNMDSVLGWAGCLLNFYETERRAGRIFGRTSISGRSAGDASAARCPASRSWRSPAGPHGRLGTLGRPADGDVVRETRPTASKLTRRSRFSSIRYATASRSRRSSDFESRSMSAKTAQAPWRLRLGAWPAFKGGASSVIAWDEGAVEHSGALHGNLLCTVQDEGDDR